MLTAFLTSILPVFVCLRADIFSSLKDGRSRIGGRGRAARATLVVIQIACAFALVVGCGLLMHTLVAYADTDFGYPTSNLVDVYGAPIPAGLYPTLGDQKQYIQRLYRNFSAIPGVRGVAFGSAVPLVGGGSDGGIDIPHGSNDADATYEFISPQYFHVLGVPILSGRDVTEADRAGSQPVAVVNQEFVRHFLPDGHAIGKHFRWDQIPFRIVGVVPTIKLHDIAEPPEPAMYFSLLQTATIGQDLSGDFVPYMLSTSVPPAKLRAQILRAWTAADPRQPLPTFSTVPDSFRRRALRPGQASLCSARLHSSHCCSQSLELRALSRTLWHDKRTRLAFAWRSERRAGKSYAVYSQEPQQW